MDGVGDSDEECVCGSDLAAAGFCGCYSYLSDYPLRIFKRLRPPFSLTVALPRFGESVSFLCTKYYSSWFDFQVSYWLQVKDHRLQTLIRMRQAVLKAIYGNAYEGASNFQNVHFPASLDDLKAEIATYKTGEVYPQGCHSLAFQMFLHICGSSEVFFACYASLFAK